MKSQTNIRQSLILSPFPTEKGEYEYMTANAYSYGKNKTYSRKMRKRPTKTELILWSYIRNHKLGYKFRRQHIINDYIVDFVCLKEKLIIEIDGEIHKYRKEYDAERTEILESEGFRVVRFTNEEILYHLTLVLLNIKQNLSSPSPEGPVEA